MQFKRWTHPKTDEQRVYVNGHNEKGIRVYFTRSDVADFPMIHLQGNFVAPGQRQRLEEKCGEAAMSAGNGTWTGLWEAAK